MIMHEINILLSVGASNLKCILSSLSFQPLQKCCQNQHSQKTCSGSYSYYVRATIQVSITWQSHDQCVSTHQTLLTIFCYCILYMHACTDTWSMILHMHAMTCYISCYTCIDSNTICTCEICSLASQKYRVLYFFTAFQNYLRTQAGNTTTVNIITCTVDYLLRLQESISDFYWHYSSQETIDLLGRDSLLKAFRVAKQVFRTLTEYIQVTC